MKKWIVLKNAGPLAFDTYGPIDAASAGEAVEQLASGDGQYTATNRGDYVAIPLEVWQDGCFGWTKTRGLEPR